VENAAAQTAHTESLLRWEGHADFLTQTLQARKKQWRPNALANGQRQEQIERLSVVELKPPKSDARWHPHPTAPPSLGFDRYTASSKTRHVSAQRAQADPQLRSKRRAGGALVGGKQAQ
jgi:hypothetical protein